MRRLALIMSDSADEVARAHQPEASRYKGCKPSSSTDRVEADPKLTTATGGHRSWGEYTWSMYSSPTKQLRPPKRSSGRTASAKPNRPTSHVNSHAVYTWDKYANPTLALKNTTSRAPPFKNTPIASASPYGESSKAINPFENQRFIPLVTNPSLGPRWRPEQDPEPPPEAVLQPHAQSRSRPQSAAPRSHERGRKEKRGGIGGRRPQSALSRSMSGPADPRQSILMRERMSITPTPYSSHVRTTHDEGASTLNQPKNEAMLQVRHRLKNSVEHQFPHKINPLYNGSLQKFIMPNGTIRNEPPN